MGKVPYIPFEKVKARVTIEDVANHLDLPIKRTNKTELRCECPVHGGGKRSLVINTAEKDKKGDPGCWYCHASGEGGDRLALYAHVRDVGQYAAVKEIAERFCPDLLGDKPKPVPEEKDEKRGEAERGFQPLPYLQPDHDAVGALGFSPDVAEALGIGFAPRGVHRGRVAIPLRQADGALAGYLSIEVDTSVKLPPKWHL